MTIASDDKVCVFNQGIHKSGDVQFLIDLQASTECDFQRYYLSKPMYHQINYKVQKNL